MVKDTEMLDALFQYATEGIIVANQKGEIVLVNPRIEKLFGYAHSELIGNKIEMLIPSRFEKTHVANRDSYFHTPHARPMGQGMSLFAKRKNGSEFPVEVSLSYYVAQGGKFAIAFLTDITERKKQEDIIQKAHRELAQYSGALETSNKDLEQFAYVASHDLQEPLRKIQSFGERLKTDR